MPNMTQIKASAGSGKTYTLTRQFLRHLAGCKATSSRKGGCSLEGPEEDWRSVMAITFTNAAATEMQERVLAVLKELALQESPARDSDLNMTRAEARVWLERIMHDRGSLNISTIDSLLNLVVRMSALSLNLPPDFTPVFAVQDIVQPVWDAMSNEAWQGNRHLRRLIQEICETTVRYGRHDDFKARNTIFAQICRVLPLIFTDHLGDLTPREVFLKADGSGLLPALRRQIALDMTTLRRADGQSVPGESKPLTFDKRYTKALDKSLGLLADQLGTGFAKASLAEYAARVRLEKDDFTSAYFFKNAPATTAKSCPCPQDLQETFVRLKSNLAEGFALEQLYKQCRIHEPLLDLVRLLHERFEEARPREGLVPNDHIPVLVRRILGTELGVADALCRMGTRISHFLVDEFQDTSRDHWQALKPLVVEALSRGGSFSWVGDVKQAIYGFRGGDSQLFDDISFDTDLVRMLDGGVTRESLAANWRSRAEIIAFNNALFASLEDAEVCKEVLCQASKDLDREATVDQVPHLCPDAASPEQTILDWTAQKMARAYAQGSQQHSPRTQSGGKVCLHLFGAQGDNGDEGQMDASDMSESDLDQDGKDPQVRAVLDLTLREHETHAWSDILVLVRTNAQAMLLARYLSRGNVPVITENSLLLGDHPLIVQSMALLSFLRAPEDDVAFWTLITGSIFARAAAAGSGLDEETASECLRALEDTALLRIARLRKQALQYAMRRPEQGSVWDEAPAEEDMDAIRAILARRSGDRPPTLAELWRYEYPVAFATLLEPLMDAAGSLTPYDLMAEWYDREEVASRFPEARPFLRRFLEILHTSQQRGIRSLGDFFDYWTEHGQEEKVPMPEGMDAVRIMTVHKAKGLQAPVVLVPWTSSRTQNSAPVEVVEYRSALYDQPLRALCRRTKVFPAWTAHRLKDAFEAVNRSYVAFTRAEERLHILVSQKPLGDGKLLQILLDRAANSIPAPEVWQPLAQDPADDLDAPAAALQPAAAELAADTDTALLATGTDFPWTLAGRSPMASDPDWEPMAWMPSLRLHFDYQDESHPRDRAREEGVIVHACLEAMARLPFSVRHDAQALERALQRIVQEQANAAPWLFAGTDFAARALAELAWFAALEQRFAWLDNGLPEQSLTTARGKVLRTDLLVLHPAATLVVEYKHGQIDDSFLQQYHGQVLAYLQTLRRTDLVHNARPLLGCIVYLRQKKLHLVLPDGTSRNVKGPVESANAALSLLDEDDFARVLGSVCPDLGSAGS